MDTASDVLWCGTVHHHVRRRAGCNVCSSPIGSLFGDSFDYRTGMGCLCTVVISSIFALDLLCRARRGMVFLVYSRVDIHRDLRILSVILQKEGNGTGARVDFVWTFTRLSNHAHPEFDRGSISLAAQHRTDFYRSRLRREATHAILGILRMPFVLVSHPSANPSMALFGGVVARSD